MLSLVSRVSSRVLRQAVGGYAAGKVVRRKDRDVRWFDYHPPPHAVWHRLSVVFIALT
ncbi:MAG: hypothetical protein RPU64_06630 [Candidatus Sedimenticola sp. (ex Thyasira tokunagai)]